MADIANIYRAEPARYDGRMVYNRVGTSGLHFPAVSLGFWHNFGSKGNFDNMRAMCRTAFDAGITQFDLANNYGPVYGSAEENAGRILREDFRAYRDELVITSKAGYDMWDGPYGNWGSRKYLVASCDQSLKRLGLEYVDIFYHHRMDPETPLEETMQALDFIVKSGRALYAGISNYNKEATQKAIGIMRELKCPLIVNQRRYSIFDRGIEDDGVKAFCRENGMGIPADSRIASDGRFLKASSLTEERMDQIRALKQLAAERGQTLAEMALAWVLKDGDVCSVLIGASKPAQILENVRAIQNCKFTEEELRRIDLICKRA